MTQAATAKPPRRIGYARVSTAEQTPRLQRDALEARGCDMIFVDRDASGANPDRRALNEALNALQSGDTLVVWRLDRLARSMRDLLEIIALLDRRGAAFESLSENFDTGTAFGQFALHIMGAVAELERQIMIERTTAGVHAARVRGRRLGRPPKLDEGAIALAHERLVDGDINIKDLAQELDVHAVTLKRAFIRARKMLSGALSHESFGP